MQPSPMRETFKPDFPSGRCSMTGHNVVRAGDMQQKTARPAARDLQGGRSPPGRHAESRGCARPPGPATDWSRRPPGQPVRRRSADEHHTPTCGVVGRDSPSPRGGVTDVAQRSLPHSRRDTPSPGWESGVWVRIQRRRRYQRVGALVLVLAAAVGGALFARERVLGDRQRSVSRRRSRARSGRTGALRCTSAGASATRGRAPGVPERARSGARVSGSRSVPSRPAVAQ